ncbi:MAG: hypothetical protein U1F83_20465 [Verrucomicrobiota bacterium]
MKRIHLWLTVCFTAIAIYSSPGASLSDSIAVIRNVGPEGKGNLAAATACQNLATAPVKELPMLLTAMDGANELALNWLRSAVDTVVARAAANKEALPLSALEKFVRDQKHNPRARRLAYELIAGADAKAAERLMAGMLDDPSSELRREAVQRLMAEAENLQKAGKTNDAVAKYQSALKPAREADQIDAIAEALKTLGTPADLQKVFGWVSEWQVVGPFDNTGGAGYERAFPPESSVDLKAEYEGKTGKVRWQEVKATGDYGVVDFNQPLGSLKGVTGYAWTEINSAHAHPVELRLGCDNGWKVWLNGKLLFGRDEYHLGSQIDDFRLTGDLKAGKNTILVKLCQNEQVADWTKGWEFQLRITDAIGTPITLVKK